MKRTWATGLALAVGGMFLPTQTAQAQTLLDDDWTKVPVKICNNRGHAHDTAAVDTVYLRKDFLALYDGQGSVFDKIEAGLCPGVMQYLPGPDSAAITDLTQADCYTLLATYYDAEDNQTRLGILLRDFDGNKHLSTRESGDVNNELARAWIEETRLSLKADVYMGLKSTSRQKVVIRFKDGKAGKTVTPRPH